MAADSIETTHATETTPSDNMGLEGFEISPQQRRAWLFQRQTDALYVQITLEIEGALDAGALKHAVEKVAEKHEILRTNFRQVPGRVFPVQVIHNLLPPHWNEIELADKAPAEQLTSAGELLSKLPSALHVESGSPFHALLLHLDDSKHLLSLCLPSLCADAASLRLLVREILAFYTKNESVEGNDPLQYADVADWQNQLLENAGSSEAGPAYWRQQEIEAPAALLPFEQEPEDSQTYRTASVDMQLDAPLTEQLMQTAGRTENGPAALLAGCWQALLCRLHGLWETPFLYASEGRTDEDFKSAVGPLTRWLPIRTTIDSTTPMMRLWRSINKSIADAAHWEYYWNGDAATANGKPGNSTADLAGFSYSESVSLPSVGGVDFSVISKYSYSCLEPLKLHLACVQQAGGLSLTFTYDDRRFEGTEIRRLANNYLALLQNALQQPDVPVGSLGMLAPDERHQLLVGWNQTDVEYPAVAGVHLLFEQAVSATPKAPALVYGGHSLTYDALNRRANQLAHTLKARGVGPDVRVGLLLERSLDLIVGLLGILKAGGAYVPLDPALPSERLQGMLQDSGARLLVTHSALAQMQTLQNAASVASPASASSPASLAQSNAAVASSASASSPAPLWAGLEVLRLDTDAETIAEASEFNPASEGTSEDLVYVIYTSGSTGRPKGVGITHANLLNYVQGVSERLGLEQGASYASVSTLAADLGNTVVFGALCTGGCLHLISSETAMDAAKWQSYLTRYPIDCLKIVPSHLSALLGSGESASARLPRKVLVLGGEATRWELVDRIVSAAPSLRVFNHYGPTETTVGVLTYALGAKRGFEEVGSRTLPLGRPLPNSRVYVLNAFLEPVAIGVTGELYIGGKGVGREYLGQPELTAERFVRDPFVNEAGARMYKTGDLCRYLADGNLEFLGRGDHQIKLRGYRIELGEIESVLLSHPSVKEAVVVAREEAGSEARLVGYVVGREGSLNVSELREYLGVKLPGYMVPSSLVVLGRLPLSANGKVDRSALPAPEAVEEAYVGASSALEEVLSGIWEELLGRERIGMAQNFFDLGGHSLLATQVISRVRETFAVDLPLRTLFDAPTIASFAEAMLLDMATRPQIESMAEMLVSLSSLSEEELEERLSQMQSGAVEVGN